MAGCERAKAPLPMSVHIDWARRDREWRRIRFCPIEGRRRRMYGWFQHWYGWTVTCLGCGDRWQDGELGARPFKRGWRREAIAAAKKAWAAAPHGRPAKFTEDELRAVFG